MLDIWSLTWGLSIIDVMNNVIALHALLYVIVPCNFGK